MATNENLLHRFLKDENKADELECFLTTSGDASQQEKGKIRFAWLEIEYDSRGRKIEAIRSVAPHNPNILTSLEKRVDEALYAVHGKEVGEAYFFTSPPVTGALRLGDVLQILPVPDDAPKIEPRSLIGDHPAILQFTYDKSTHTLVNQHRREKRKRELFLLLNALVRNGISWIGNTARKSWVWDVRGEDLTDYCFRYCQIGYGSRQEWDQRDESGFFVNPCWSEIPRKAHSPYYGDLGFMVGEPFQLPDSLESSVDRYHQLDENESALFMRSAHWLAKCSEVFGHSHSLAYVSLVYALEGLVPAATKTGQCDHCGRDQFDKSISVRFKEFLEEYGTDLSSGDVKEMYRLRSAIAHGGGLMPRDREITGFRFTAEQNEKDAIFRQLRRVCETVLINWLHNDKRSRTT